MLKKINPEDLKEGQEYYVKLKFYFKDTGLTPYCFRDILEDDYWYHKDQPIYTLEDQSIISTIQEQPIVLTHDHHPDPELAMLVNVASRLYVSYSELCEISNKDMPTMDTCANEASAIIAACKRIKEGER